MESQMTKEENQMVMKRLLAQLELEQREKQELVQIYENQKRIVKDLATISVVSIVIHITIIQLLLGQDNLSLHALGSYIQPFNFFLFMTTSVLAGIKGYDFFLNTNHKWACKINERLKKSSLSYEIQCHADSIYLLRQEVDKLQCIMTEQNPLLQEEEEENSGELWMQDIMKEETL